MADDLAVALGVLTVLGILVFFGFIKDLYYNLTTSLGTSAAVPVEISTLVLIGALGAGILVYMSSER